MLWERSGPGDLSFITWVADSGGSDGEGGGRRAYEEIRGRLNAANLVILNERIFGEVSTAASVVDIRAAAHTKD